MNINRPIIISQFPPIFPPIPDRRFDYRACFEGDEEEPWNHGWGATEEEARADLMRLIEEWQEWEEAEAERLLEEKRRTP